MAQANSSISRPARMYNAIRRLLSFYEASAVAARTDKALQASALACYRRANVLIAKYYPYTVNGRKGAA